jgi:hypothetical protein
LGEHHWIWRSLGLSSLRRRKRDGRRWTTFKGFLRHCQTPAIPSSTATIVYFCHPHFVPCLTIQSDTCAPSVHRLRHFLK